MVNKDVVKNLIYEYNVGDYDNLINIIRNIEESDIDDFLKFILGRMTQDKYIEIEKVLREQTLKTVFNNFNEKYLSGLYATSKAYEEKMSSCIYFIRNDYNNKIKIGSTNDIINRFSDFKRYFNFVGLEPKITLIALVLTFDRYKKSLENSFHEYYRNFRYKNEWYTINADDVINDFISASDKFDIIDNVLIDYSEYEFEFYRNIKKDFKLCDEEVKYSNTYYDKNPLWEIMEIINKNKINIGENYYNFESGKCEIEGIKCNNSDKMLTFEDIKTIKYDREYWKNVINRLKNIV